MVTPQATGWPSTVLQVAGLLVEGPEVRGMIFTPEVAVRAIGVKPDTHRIRSFPRLTCWRSDMSCRWLDLI